MKERLDVLLVKRNLAESREKAKAVIMSGNVFVEGQREDKAGTSFSENANIEVRGSVMPYVSRGGLKLEKAMSSFHLCLNGLVCTDVGSSTGGFTDCMLQKGARKVYAIDVGRGQLDWKLRQDERVVCMEKTNIRYVKPEDLGEEIDFSSIDVSFISLIKVLKPIREYLKEKGEVVALIKPQFEAGREKIGKKGVVREKSTHYEVLEKVTDYAVSIGFHVCSLTFSPIKGPEGNIEYLVYLKKCPVEEACMQVPELHQVVEQAFRELTKSKDGKHFYIITNTDKDKNLEITRRVKQYLEAQGQRCTLGEHHADGTLSNLNEADGASGVLVLGGDGTLIQAARELRNHEAPMLGVNMGTLGYLTELEVQHIEQGLQTLIKQPPIIEERMMLKGTVNGQTEDIALNDIVVTRLGELRVIRVNVYVNGELLKSYQADGMIISTPTGSTGYNMSAGGPIVEPTASMIVLTPICSHALNTSSIVLSAEDEIRIEIGQGRGNSIEQAGISFDGTKMIQVGTGEYVTIKKAEVTTKLIKLSKASFLETLREKMKGN